VKDQENAVRAAAPDERQLKELEKKVATYKKSYDESQEVSSEVEEAIKK